MANPRPRRRSLRCQVALRDGGVCIDCPPGTPPYPNDAWDADHAIALVHGGQDDLSNIVTRCKPHHQAKTAANREHRPNRDMVMTSLYIGRGDKAAVAELAAERGEAWSEQIRTMLAYGELHMPKGWKP